MAQVILKNVTKTFEQNGVEVVKNLNLVIPDKEFFVLVGPSGCGKTTALRMIAGLEEVTSGEIYIGDRLVNDVPPKNRDIAMVFQNYALYPHMNVYNNMAFGLKLRGSPKKEIEQRVNEAAEILNIKHLLHRRPKELSGGQRQRVAVGRAIVRKPKVFLFDEPLSNLDAKLRVQMRAEISKLHDRLQTTMIYVTHDQTEAMTMGDRICVMKEGIIQQIQTPLNLYDKPSNKFVGGFIGSPPMNFFKVKLIAKGSKYFLQEKSFIVKIPDAYAAKLSGYLGKQVFLGLRPEDIQDKDFFKGDGPDDKTVKAVVDVVEPMGHEIYLYLNTAEHSMVVRANHENKAQVGQQISLVFNMDKAHIFDIETEISIV